jgi:hypothetical protein
LNGRTTIILGVAPVIPADLTHLDNLNGFRELVTFVLERFAKRGGEI